jgi:predicted porin
MTSYNVIYSLVSDVGRVYYSLGDYLMKKALLPLLIASVLPSAAFADVVVYGKAWVALQAADVEAGSGTVPSGVKTGVNNYAPGTYTEVRNNESRLGIKGSEVINDDLKAIYQMEFKVFADDGSTLSQRNTYVGLQGNLGTVKAGLFDTPLKLAQEKTDVFKDMQGDWKNVFEGEVRAKNITQYSSPTYFFTTLNIAYVAGEQDLNNSIKSGYSTSLVYDTKAVYLALATDHNVKPANDNSPSALAAKIKDSPAYLNNHQVNVDIVRLVGRFTVGPVVLGAMYETYDNGVKNSQGDEEKDGLMFSAIYNINDTWAVKAQNGTSDMIAEGGVTNSIGVDYKYSKVVKVTGYFTTLKDDGIVSVPAVAATATAPAVPAGFKVDPKAKHDDKWAGVALEFTF